MGGRWLVLRPLTGRLLWLRCVSSLKPTDDRIWPMADPTRPAQARVRLLRYTGRAGGRQFDAPANDQKRPSAHKGPQMLDERARLRGTPTMGRHEGVDRQRRTAPSGERLDERAALEIVADQQFGREADP